MKRIRLVSVLIVAFVGLGSFVCLAQDKAVKQFKLDNGLTIILNEDHSKTEVFGMVVVKAGAKNDPKDATGMAHYQEHMLFKGTTELGTSNWEKEKPHIDRIIELYDELAQTKDDSLRLKIQKEINKESIEAGKYTILNETSNLIDQMGGTNLNAGTGVDQTVYYNSFPPNQIERWIELYSHRFINPVFRAFQAELETVYEEKNMYEDSFITKLLEAFNKNLYKNHPYGQQTIIGTTEHLKNPSLSKMYAFFNTYYVANNMAVVLIGDFDSETVIPMLEEKFGQWKNNELPVAEKYEEVAFNGREEFVGKFSPIKLAILGFRTVPSGHPDELALSVFNNLIYNEKGTGKLNKLVQNGEVMEIEAISMHNIDYGADMFLVIPKLIGQKLKTAEDLVLNEVRKVQAGDFDDKELDQAKMEMYVNFTLSLEDFEERGNILSEYFVQGKNADEMLNMPEKIKGVTKEDVLKVANKYYGDNYLAFYSKMGAPKKEKLNKPNYDPVTTDKKGKSVFAKKFENIPEKKGQIKFVDFENDLNQAELKQGVNLYVVNNPKNDIYTADIVFQVGNLQFKEAKYVADLLNVAGTKDLSRDDLQASFAEIGSSYYCQADGENVQISLSGIEKNMPEAFSLIGRLINAPVLREKDMAVVADNAISGRKYEREEPADVAQALLGTIVYGEKSSSRYRLSKKQIKKFNVESFNRIWSDITSFESEIHYVGKEGIQAVSDVITKNIKFSEQPKQMDEKLMPSMKEYHENVIYVVNRKKALQSNIYFFSNGSTFSKEDVPVQQAFNSYYGGGFSGLVLQEIREYRSLAYSAWSAFINPEKEGKKSYFVGSIGTQADKTLDAISVFFELKNDMPQMPERMTYIKPYLEQQAITSYPGFRDVSHSIQEWKDLGYEKDPAIWINQQVKDIQFGDIYKYYQSNLQKKPMVTMIVGDKSKIDLKELSKFGKVKFIKEKSLYTK
ncbi:MAG: insulinase family protein [Carboxylicivirga sp.]|jgi:predicted Zn-dependent peptidase|nr:insulinase family protein [Carboxylicivirga sp.]